MKVSNFIMAICFTHPFIAAAQAYIPQRFDVVMEEIMADPSPAVTLPAAEFIEIKNISTQPINLSGWKINTASSSSGSFPGITLLPDSFLILSSAGNAMLFVSFGKTLAVPSFPALPNDGSLLTLVSKEGKTIHALNYSTDWYQNPVKQQGGWSLEMIDPHNPCGGKSNWKASIDPSGGTPGKKNSVDGLNEDQTSPKIIRTYSLDSLTLIAEFDEPLDSSSAVIASHYSLEQNIIIAANPQPPLFNQVVLKTSFPLQKRTVARLTVNDVSDCRGNVIDSYHTVKAGMWEEALAKDLVVNEILFNPRPGAFDYVELFNPSIKVLDASHLYIANRNSAGDISSLKKLRDAPFDIFPGDYIVITEDASSLQREYLVKTPDKILTLSALPSYPDDKGTVVLTDIQSNIIDEAGYSDQWHFALIYDPEGIALERIDPSASSNDSLNWHSAASTAGFGTPTYKNSQYRTPENISAMVDISPKIFSPDNDGLDDLATIGYHVDQPGYVANISIFDLNGRLIRYLVKNALLGLIGSWNWDGLDENRRPLPVGVYIIYTELFNLQGKKKNFRGTIVLARRMH